MSIQVSCFSFLFYNSIYFSLIQNAQTSYTAHPVSYSMGTGGCCPGVRRPWREAEHSPPSSAKVRNECLHGLHRNDLTFSSSTVSQITNCQCSNTNPDISAVPVLLRCCSSNTGHSVNPIYYIYDTRDFFIKIFTN